MFAAILALHLFGLGRPPEQEVQRYSVKPWILTKTYDKIGRETDCVISGPGRVTVYNSTVVVDLGRHADTSRAVFALAGEAPRRAEANWPLDLPRRVIDRTPTGNPSDGLVLFPLAWVADAERAEVRRQPKAHAIKLDLKGLKAARAAALGLGCPVAAS